MSSREVLFSPLGKPDAIGIGSRKYPRPCVYKYGMLEFYFDYPEDGRLLWIQWVDGKGDKEIVWRAQS